MKEAHLKGLQTIWFQVYATWKGQNYGGSIKITGLPRDLQGVLMWQHRKKKNLTRMQNRNTAFLSVSEKILTYLIRAMTHNNQNKLRETAATASISVSRLIWQAYLAALKGYTNNPKSQTAVRERFLGCNGMHAEKEKKRKQKPLGYYCSCSWKLKFYWLWPFVMRREFVILFLKR